MLSYHLEFFYHKNYFRLKVFFCHIIHVCTQKGKKNFVQVLLKQFHIQNLTVVHHFSILTH